MTTEEVLYFDVNGREVPPALATQYASRVVRITKNGRTIVKQETFNAPEPLPALPTDEEDVGDELPAGLE